MSESKPRFYDEANGLDYILISLPGDYYIPAIEPPEDDDRPVFELIRTALQLKKMVWVKLAQTILYFLFSGVDK